MTTMTKEQYRAARQQRGTIAAVAKLLGIHWITLQRRETGSIAVTSEAATAMASLPTRKRKTIKTRATKKDEEQKLIELEARTQKLSPEVVRAVETAALKKHLGISK